MGNAAELGIHLQVVFMHYLCRNPPIAKGALPLQGPFSSQLHNPFCCSAPSTCGQLIPLHSHRSCLPALSTPCSCWALWCSTSVARSSMWHPWCSPWPWAGPTCSTTPGASSRWGFTPSWSPRSVQGAAEGAAEPQSRKFWAHLAMSASHIDNASLCYYFLSEVIKCKWCLKTPCSSPVCFMMGWWWWLLFLLPAMLQNSCNWVSMDARRLRTVQAALVWDGSAFCQLEISPGINKMLPNRAVS